MTATAIAQYTLPQLAAEAGKSVSALKEWYRLNKSEYPEFSDLQNTPLSSSESLIMPDRQTAFFFAYYPPLSGQTDRQTEPRQIRKIIPIADRQTDRIETDRQTETELTTLRQTVADRDRQIETDRQKHKAETDRQTDRIKQLETDRQTLKQDIQALKSQFEALKGQKGESDVQLRTLLAQKEADITVLQDRLQTALDSLRQTEADRDRQKRQFETELRQKFEEYEAAFQTEVEAMQQKLRTENEARLKAEKGKMIFEREAFAKYGLLLLTIIQVYVAGRFLDSYLEINNFWYSMPLAIPIPFGGLLMTIYLGDEEENNYLFWFSILFAVVEAAVFYPKCYANDVLVISKAFGTTVYIVVMLILINAYGKIYTQIKKNAL